MPSVLPALHAWRSSIIAKAFDFRRGIGCIPFMLLLEGEGSLTTSAHLPLTSFLRFRFRFSFIFPPQTTISLGPLKSQSILISCLCSLPALTHLCLDPRTMMQNRFNPERKIVPVPIMDNVLVRRLTVSPASFDVDLTQIQICPPLPPL